MVRKLIKYDFQSFFRLLFPVQLIVIGIAVLNRFIQFFENTESKIYEITFNSSVALFCVACAVALVMTYVIAIIRFYQGLYSGEGYLSHTLPVTVNQHIFSKLIVSILFLLGTLLSIFIAVCAASCGDVLVELFKALGYLFKELFKFGGFHSALFIIEWLLCLFAYAALALLIIYFCISIGQLANRLKVLLAFGIYFALYTLAQIISTTLIIIFSTIDIEPLIEAIKEFIDANTILSVHMISVGILIIELIFAFIFFIISRTIMKKKLNLT